MPYRMLLLILLLASCKKDEVHYAGRVSYYRNLNNSALYNDSLHVMTYNIQNGFMNGVDPWTLSNTGCTPRYLDSMAVFLSSTGADIIALQEVPLNRSNTVIKNLLDSLGGRLQMNYAFAAHGFNDAYGAERPIKGQWGVAILSKYPITEMESREVCYENVWTRRSTLRARLGLTATRQIDIYCLHHTPMPDGSDLQKSARFVMESSLPVIVCGDFNVMPDVTMTHLPLIPAWDVQQMNIDLIFHASEFTHYSWQQYPGITLSDHSAMVVGLKY